MNIHFKSIRSGSSANCLLLRLGKDCVLIDCGIKTQWELNQIIKEHAGGPERIKGVVISHGHSDHINHSSLRVLEDLCERRPENVVQWPV